MSDIETALERSAEIAGQCRATASHPIAGQMLVDAGNGLLADLLIDAAVTIELLSSGLRACDWQPIETALKDGSYIWLGSPSSVRVGFWRNGAEYENHNSVGGGWIDKCAAEQVLGTNGLHFEPTHWMPTPKPPSPASNGET